MWTWIRKLFTLKKRKYAIYNIEDCNLNFGTEGKIRWRPEFRTDENGEPFCVILAKFTDALDFMWTFWKTNRRANTRLKIKRFKER